MYSGEKVENPVAERTRNIQEWGVLTAWQKTIKGPMTFTQLAKQWAPTSRNYARDIQTIADALLRRTLQRRGSSARARRCRRAARDQPYDRGQGEDQGERLSAVAAVDRSPPCIDRRKPPATPTGQGSGADARQARTRLSAGRRRRCKATRRRQLGSVTKTAAAEPQPLPPKMLRP